jgi:SAM-dependent methyltransferase
MDEETAVKLLDLNRRFYQKFAEQFSRTRQRLQPGVQQILRTIPPGANVLDLGCGNGELARALVRRGHQGEYIGVDFGERLLAEARRTTARSLQAQFILADLTAPDWEAGLTLETIDIILAFAVLHHIPGKDRRRQILQKSSRILSPHGRLVHSEWQFLNSPRLVARIQAWETVGLAVNDVDSGDYLLDWRRGGLGFRYVHSFSEEELAGLASDAGFEIAETFSSDGETGNLGLYQVWKRV